jgi:hypothetical protein
MNTKQSESGTDRRRHPRLALDWPLSITLPDGIYQARLRDVSRSGVCFFLDRRIPEMTILRMSLDLPQDGGESMPPIQGSGVVVRCRQLSQHVDHYEVAVFLNDVTDEHRERLATYVDAAV